MFGRLGALWGCRVLEQNMQNVVTRSRDGHGATATSGGGTYARSGGSGMLAGAVGGGASPALAIAGATARRARAANE
jgi:hypothetical protein